MHAAYVNMPESLIQNVTQLLSEQIDDTMATHLRRTVTFKIGACVDPVFSIVSGGTGRTLSTFKNVFENCPSFLDIRAFPDEKRIMWALMSVTHSYTFAAFPLHVPRNVIPDGVKEEL